MEITFSSLNLNVPQERNLYRTERKVYDQYYEGISAGKLVKETGLSMRRTYKYSRGLKGKKLVFIRRTPKAYEFNL